MTHIERPMNDEGFGRVGKNVVRNRAAGFEDVGVVGFGTLIEFFCGVFWRFWAVLASWRWGSESEFGRGANFD